LSVGTARATHLAERTFVFDNGFRRNFGPNGEMSFSRGVEYAVDESAMTVRQV